MKVSRRDNLDRYYLLKLFGYGIFFHHIHHDEDKDVFHNHPWNGISIIFGSYREERYMQGKKLRRFFNLIKATRFHRVEISKPVWTLFIHGRKCNHWQVMNRAGKILDTEPWEGIGGRTSYKPSVGIHGENI
jgi:hypothetical protein